MIICHCTKRNSSKVKQSETIKQSNQIRVMAFDGPDPGSIQLHLSQLQEADDLDLFSTWTPASSQWKAILKPWLIASADWTQSELIPPQKLNGNKEQIVNIFFLFLSWSFFFFFKFGWHAESLCLQVCGQSKGKVLSEPLLALGVRGVDGGVLRFRRASQRGWQKE